MTHVSGITDIIGIDPNAQQRPGSILARNAAGTNLWNVGTYAYDGTDNVKSIGGSGFAYDITRDGGRNMPTNSATNRLNGPGMFYDTAGNHTANSGAIHEYDLVFLWKVLF